jgi:hypothetical protein
MKLSFSEKDPELFIMIAVINVIVIETNIMASDIMKEIVINDQKFFEALLKNSCMENLILSFLKLSNSPPVRNALRTKEINKTSRKPAEKDLARLFNTGPRSVNTFRSNPLLRLSVIMLLPKALLNVALKGAIRSETVIKEQNQTSKMPFHDFNARLKPDDSELLIFI